MYQFIHIESYSKSPPKSAQHKNKKTGKASGKKAGHCVNYVVKEATRDPDSIPHIDNPQPPIYHHGKPLEQLEETCTAWMETMKDGKGRAMRKDALCLVAGVASAPHDISEEAWQAFRADLIKWLQEKYGERLQTIIEHTDESHPHLHFYVVPLPGERFEVIHEGKAAAALEKANGGLKGEQNQAYKSAMRDFQDQFYNGVGIEHGFTRIGPGKRRLTREEWKLEQIQAEAAAAAIKKANEAIEHSKEQSAEIKTTALGEAQDIKQTARSEARKISQEALKKADEIQQKAAVDGFNSGLDAVEKMPWWKKVGAALSRAVRERDELREQVKTIQEEKTTWLEKAQGLLQKGAKAAKRLREVEPELKAAKSELLVTQPKAKEAEKLREKTERLESALSSERAKNQHLEATVEALNRQLEPENGPVEKKDRVRERGEEMSL